MEKLITVKAELDILMDAKIIHPTERDWLAQGIDNGYQVKVQIGKENKGKFPMVLTLTREGTVDKKKPEKPGKVVDMKGRPLMSPSETRQTRRAAKRELDKRNQK